MGIPDYIARQLRRSPPEDCCVQPDTLPHIAEGYLEEAKIAVVGINPHGAVKRSHYPPMDQGGDKLAWADKREYFECRKYPYFTLIDHILNECATSFGGKYDREERYARAVAIDVVQWATEPLWAGLSPEVKNRLLDDGAPFFANLLHCNPNIDLLLGNGRSVLNVLQERFNAKFKYVGSMKIGRAQNRTISVYCGELLGRQFIGWSGFLSRAGMTNDQIAELGRWVYELYGKAALKHRRNIMADNTNAATIGIPPYFRERLLSPVPQDCNVAINHCLGAVPIISFGDISQACAATISLNPNTDKDALPPVSYNGLPESKLQRVFTEYNEFFHNVHTKKKFFGQLEEILNACGFTYGGNCGERHGTLGRKSSAVSLEIVQWATRPTWSGLSRYAKDELLKDGIPFLEAAVRQNPKIKLLLGHGRTVREVLEGRFGVNFKKVASINLNKGQTDVYCGKLLGRCFIGWNAFLPSQRWMTNAQRTELAKCVGELYHSACP